MARAHTLVEYRLKEFELEQALRSLKKQQDGLDYKLDVEFYFKLEELTKRHGYTLKQVFDLLMARYESSTDQAGGDAVSLKAKTNAGLLEMIQRLESGRTRESPETASSSSKFPLVHDAKLESVSERTEVSEPSIGSDPRTGTDPVTKASHDLALMVEVEDHDYEIEGKSHD
ncbi:hypothetical protein [Pseudomonas frederiksbergensis]|uniref:Uncharacterized protein n=1 Tax=Pseudomonas frederiksbergensis TaxID=104087 RepID=A0A423KGA8_9PSED|nr:hypothetical protein [Pseudomonas frederiksbergensis]RON51850.1 hypothetical protein BK665_18500 [Pseudomonas frederiksbergensis]